MHLTSSHENTIPLWGEGTLKVNLFLKRNLTKMVSKHQSLGAGREAVASQEKMSLTGIYLENGLLFLLLPRMVVPAGPSLALSLNQLAGGSFKSVFSSRRANAVRGGAEEYFTTARLFTSLPPRNKADP